MTDIVQCEYSQPSQDDCMRYIQVQVNGHTYSLLESDAINLYMRLAEQLRETLDVHSLIDNIQ